MPPLPLRDHRWAMSIRYLLVGLAVALAIDGVAFANHALAQGRAAPQLPPEPSPIGALRRAPNGQIEVVDPTKDSSGKHARCSKGTICVGKGASYPTLNAALAVARPGDTLEIIGGTYHETAKIETKHLTLRGVAGQPHFTCDGLRIAEDKACLLIAADGVTLDNLEISGAQITQDLGANGACVRNEPNIGFTLRHVICHRSQDGVLADGGSILIEDSQFYDNGWDGLSHNAYFAGDCTVTVRGSVFRDARVGHEFKSRCRKTEISDSTFRSTKGSRDLDIPDGGETSVFHSTFFKGQGTENSEIIGFAAESCAHPGSMVLRDVTIITQDPGADIRNFDKCVGHTITFDHATFEGPPPKMIGAVVVR